MNEEEIKPNLNYLNNFLGYGDSDKARVFHIAIEEKLDPNSDHGKVLSKFISQRDNGEIEILEKTTVHPGTEKLQSKLTYRLITEILEIDIKCSEEEYLQLDFKILRDLEFCSNVNPIACPAEGKWANINTVITGYDSKTKYLIDSWNGTGNFVRIKPRKEVLIEFLTKIKCRMENEKIFLFIEGKKPFRKLKDLLDSVFDIDTNSDKDRVHHLSHIGKPIYSFYGDLIWSVGHPSYKGRYFNLTDINTIIANLKNTRK